MLKIKRTGFPSIMDENRLKYFDYISLIIKDNDENAIITFDKSGEIVKVSIDASQESRYKIIEDLRIAHSLIGIPILFSKSLKISKLISYEFSY